MALAVDAPCILLIEDEVELAEVIKDFLEWKGFRVQTAFNGIEARSQLSQAPGTFQLVIADLKIPGISPEELIDGLMPRSKIPWIIYSASTEEFPWLCKSASAYFKKPADLELISDEALRLIQESQ
jgi:DNA-binding response OmpR family regulator